jgi:type II secretory pathway pseudopilin PulG
MSRIGRGRRPASGGFSLLELLLLMALLMLLASWGLHISSRKAQWHGAVQAVHAILQEAADRMATGPTVLLVGNRAGTEELRELLLAERRNGQLVPLADSHLQLPPRFTIAPPDAAVPVDDSALAGHWLVATHGSLDLILHLPNGTDCHFSTSENGTIVRTSP